MYYLNHAQNAESKQVAKNVISYCKRNNLALLKSPEKAHALISVGDDKHILETIRLMGKDQKPLLAIGTGGSFLAQSDAATFSQSLDVISKKKYKIQQKARLRVLINNKAFEALNDVGIFSSKSASIVRYTLSINHTLLWKDTADGIVIATPTGSTGYSYSAYGPIILGEPSVTAITPISSLSKRSTTIVSAQEKIVLSGIQTQSPVVILDGDVRVPLKRAEITITSSSHPAQFIQVASSPDIDHRLKKRSTTALSRSLTSLPPSAKLLYKILSYEGSLTQKELLAASSLPTRTVRHALDILVASNLITQQPYLNDARQTVYAIA